MKHIASQAGVVSNDYRLVGLNFGWNLLFSISQSVNQLISLLTSLQPGDG